MIMHIPFVDLKTQYQSIRFDIKKVINEVLDSGEFVMGKHNQKFEEEFARFCGVKYALGLDSGISALELGMRTLGFDPDDEVITPVNSFIASSSSIVFAGAKPVLIDCDTSFNLDIEQLEKLITKKTKAIMPVHLFGRPVDMDKLEKISKKYNLAIIEDACQAHGASVGGKSIGSFGDFAAFSFYPGKNLGK